MSNCAQQAQLSETLVVTVAQEYHVAEAQQAARSLAEAMGFSETAVYSIATAVSELANNIFFHASGGGTITLKVLRQKTKTGIEVAAVDSGPGIEDVAAAMQDGYTTRGGLGGGLPGAKRLMDQFHITSSPGKGTCVVARKWRT